jgi:hypothetical protein
MNPTLKKLLAAVAVKEGIEKIQEWRKPQKPSIWARLGKTAVIVGAGAGAYYAYKNGMFNGVIDQLKGKAHSDEYSYSPSDEVNVAGSERLETPAGSPTT